MFYMLGRVWADGNLPYTDIVDVKGPLLIAIYAFAYLISPGNPYVVYLIHALFVSITLFYSYRTAILFLNSSTKALIAATLIILYVVNPLMFCGGNQSEIIMMVPTAICLYYFIRTAIEQELHFADLIKLGIIAGSCFSICLLIKYNNILFPLTISTLVFIRLIKTNRRLALLLCYCLFFLSGVALWALPFCLYFIEKGIWNDFIRVYFTLNFNTYNSYHGSIISIVSILRLFALSLQWVGATMTLIIISSIAALPQKGEYRTYLSSSLFFLVASVYIPNAAGQYGYYLLMISPFAIIPCTALLHQWVHTPRWRTTGIAMGIIALSSIQFCGNWYKLNFCRITNKPASDVAFFEYELKQHPESKILYVGHLDEGFGLRSCALPAIPEWCTLNGSPPSDSPKRAIIQRIPDYVIESQWWGNPELEDGCFATMKSDRKTASLLRENGYRCISTVKNPGNPSRIMLIWKKE